MPECQEKTDFGHFKHGFDLGARREGPMQGQEKLNLGLYLLFSCQEKTPECQEKTDFGHSKLGFHFWARRKGLRARIKRILARICLSRAGRGRRSDRSKQSLVILRLDFTLRPGEKVSGLG